MRILGLKELSSVHTSLVQKPEVVDFAMKFLKFCSYMYMYLVRWASDVLGRIQITEELLSVLL